MIAFLHALGALLELPSRKRLMRLALRVLLLCLAGFSPLAAHAQEVSAVRVQPTNAAVGQPVRITVYLETGDEPAGCGLRVTLGDGAFRQIRADLTNMPVTFNYVYSRGGDFTVRAAGDLYLRGLRTALACRGDKSAAVRVVDVEAERRQAAKAEAERQAAEAQAAAQRERERAEREAAEALKAQQKAEREAADRRREMEARARALSEREAEARRLDEQREREIAEREEALRRTQRKVEAREKALEAREKKARQEAAAMARKPSEQSSSGSSTTPAPKSKPSESAPRGTLDAF